MPDTILLTVFSYLAAVSFGVVAVSFVIYKTATRNSGEEDSD